MHFSIFLGEIKFFLKIFLRNLRRTLKDCHNFNMYKALISSCFFFFYLNDVEKKTSE